MYYFKLNIAHFSKATYSLLHLLAFLTIFLGAVIFNRWFKNYEFRTLISMAYVIWFSHHLINLVFVLRINVAYGVDDLTFITFATLFHDALGVSFYILPLTVLFAKLTPKHIEATIFATMTGMVNLSLQVISPLIAARVANYLEVTKDNLDNFSLMIAIQMPLCLVPILFIKLVPSREEIRIMQKSYEEKLRLCESPGIKGKS